jgi:HEAT repeat protein
MGLKKRLFQKADAFELDTLLTMSQDHYVNEVWPVAFYIAKENIAKWKINAARAIGNQGDREHVPVLKQVLSENGDETVRGMCGWALERLNGREAGAALDAQISSAEALAREEIELALAKM